MNRPIKFRAWNIEEKLMHDPAFPSWNGSIEVWKNNIPQGTVQYLSNGPADAGVLIQFTGRLDEAGKSIYEGDIVKRVDIEHGPIGKVVFEKGCFVAIINQAGQTPYRRNVCDEDARFEVIGNVFENPELLKA